MISNTTTLSARLSRSTDGTASARRGSRARSSGALAFVLLAFASATGCAVETEVAAEEDVASTEDALSRPTRPTTGTGYTCNPTTRECTCDKGLENDCAYMSGVCTDASIDRLIECIKGWGTTHCTCTMAKVAPTPTTRPPVTHAPIGSTGSSGGLSR